MADRAGGAEPGLRRRRPAPAHRLGGVVLARPDRDPRRRPGHRPGRRPRPLQPAGRRDRGAGEGPLLPLDHLPVPAHPVRRLRRRVLPPRPPGASADWRRGTRSGWRSPSAASAASASTPPTSSATRRRPTSAGCPRSRWPRSRTATSTSSTTAATTSASRPRRTRPAAGWARASTQFWPRTVGGSAAVRVAPGEAPLRPQEAAPVPARQRRPQRLADDGRAVGRLVAWLGVGIAPYLLLQAVVGFSLLEVVNYMEHYGMLRQKVGVGERRRYERVLPGHSWNSNNIATNVLLYHLQRHSDHHANPTRRYQALRDFEESPVLPTGYAGMIVLALVPPVWRRVMDQRVVAHFGGDVSRANISPRKRERYLARYDARVRRRGADGAARTRRPASSRRCSPRAARVAPTPTRSPPATSTRASPPAPRGPTSPPTGAAPTAGSGTRPTSCRVDPSGRWPEPRPRLRPACRPRADDPRIASWPRAGGDDHRRAGGPPSRWLASPRPSA